MQRFLRGLLGHAPDHDVEARRKCGLGRDGMTGIDGTPVHVAVGRADNDARVNNFSANLRLDEPNPDQAKWRGSQILHENSRSNLCRVCIVGLSRHRPKRLSDFRRDVERAARCRCDADPTQRQVLDDGRKFSRSICAIAQSAHDITGIALSLLSRSVRPSFCRPPER